MEKTTKAWYHSSSKGWLSFFVKVEKVTSKWVWVSSLRSEMNSWQIPNLLFPLRERSVIYVHRNGIAFLTFSFFFLHNCFVYGKKNINQEAFSTFILSRHLSLWIINTYWACNPCKHKKEKRRHQPKMQAPQHVTHRRVISARRRHHGAKTHQD